MCPEELIFIAKPHGLHVLSEIRQTIQMALPYQCKYLNKYYCKTKLRLRVSDRKEKLVFAQECFYFSGIFSYIKERDTSSPGCKYKHMLENGAPPEKFDVLYGLLHTEFHGFINRIDDLGLPHLGSR